jgi:hypothetical protein
MEIELLYFEGCPHWIETRKLLSETLEERGLPDDVTLVPVESNEDAQRHQFMGSPSVRINGVDVEPGILAVGFNMECRLYWIDGRAAGVPARKWVEDALEAAAGRQ